MASAPFAMPHKITLNVASTLLCLMLVAIEQSSAPFVTSAKQLFRKILWLQRHNC